MRKTIKKALILATAALACSWWAAPLALAVQGFYAVDQGVRTGMLVSLNKNPGVVEPASINNAAGLVGVVGSSATDYTVEPGQIAVQTDGVVQTLVTTISGDIAVGDQISPSAIVGLGAKAEQSGWVVGIAQGSLAANSNGAVKTTVTDTSGQPREVYVATIPVLVKVMYQASDQNGDDKNKVLPDALQELADFFAGKKVSPVAVMLSFFLLFVGLGAAGIILNTTIRNSLLAISRQPLSKPDILRHMLRSVVLAFSLLVITLLGALVIIRIL